MPALTEGENSVWLDMENGGKRKGDLSFRVLKKYKFGSL